MTGVVIVESGKRFSFNKADRLLNSHDFSSVFDDAPFRASHSQFLILSRPNSLDYPRLGLIISKKNSRLAVNRNRIKRLIRESFRFKQHNLPSIDAIVLARRGTETLNNSEIFGILEDLWKRVATKAKNQKIRPVG